METINLTIPNMKSAHCMMSVRGTLNNLEGTTIKKMESGEVEIELSGATKASVVDAIEKAGYLVANK